MKALTEQQILDMALKKELESKFVDPSKPPTFKTARERQEYHLKNGDLPAMSTTATRNYVNNWKRSNLLLGDLPPDRAQAVSEYLDRQTEKAKEDDRERKRRAKVWKEMERREDPTAPFCVVDLSEGERIVPVNLTAEEKELRRRYLKNPGRRNDG